MTPNATQVVNLPQPKCARSCAERRRTQLARAQLLCCAPMEMPLQMGTACSSMNMLVHVKSCCVPCLVLVREPSIAALASLSPSFYFIGFPRDDTRFFCLLCGLGAHASRLLPSCRVPPPPLPGRHPEKVNACFALLLLLLLLLMLLLLLSSSSSLLCSAYARPPLI